MYKHICQYEKCKKEFESKTARAKYCCNSHRVSAQRHGLGDATDASAHVQQATKSLAIKKMDIAMPHGMDFGTQMVFDMIKKESQRFEDAYNEQKKKNEKLIDEKAALEKEFLNFKHESEKQKLIDAKPSGLAGIADHPFIKELGTHMAPHVASMLGRVMNPGLPEADQTALWLDQQPDDVKNGIRELITNVATIQDPVLMLKVIQQLIAVIQKGSTINSQQQTRRTGTDGGMGLGNF